MFWQCIVNHHKQLFFYCLYLMVLWQNRVGCTLILSSMVYQVDVLYAHLVVPMSYVICTVICNSEKEHQSGYQFLEVQQSGWTFVNIKWKLTVEHLKWSEVK